MQNVIVLLEDMRVFVKDGRGTIQAVRGLL
jgi:hypothetical protein